ncbi:MAG: serine/threonine-protein kinase, partial [Verrucomicrobiales bacterium]|nr:serine/threonine-protein kinase [Verrucomicrobiales bacterium]
DLLKPGEPLPLTELARYATAVANALGSAHAAGIVHRDIKPANILTDPQSGRVWITDFGIAKPAGTPASSVNGTPHYISPEQARGEPTTPASDLFSLGVVLYEMATGSRPFDGGNTRAILAAVASHQPPPPSELNASVPPALDSLIIALLAKSPSDRPASAAGVSPVLENLTQPDHTWRRLGVLAITAIAITVTAVFLRPDETPATPPLPKPLFSLFGDGRSFPTLAGALAATTAGSSTVVINSNSTLESEPITTPPHPVVIRAARGTTPTLRFSGAGSPLFTATASLELRHLTVVQRPLRRAAENITPVISSSGASVTVTHCRIARIAPAIGRLPGGDFNLEVLPPVIRFEKASKLPVTRSEIYAIRGVCISTLIPAGSTSVHIDNSVIASRRFIETTAGTSASLTLTLDNNLLMASAVLDFLPNPTHPQLQASAHNNIFELRGGMVWARGRNPQEFAKTFSWDGSSNVYQIPHVAVHYGTAFSITNANRPSQHAFDTWTALPFVEETDSFSRNIKASERLDLHNTPLDTITASDFSFPPNSDELTSGSGPDAPYIGPGNTRLPRDGSALGKSL